MENKRLEVKYMITDLIFMVLVILFLPSTQTYYLRRNPYGSDALQIPSPLPMPYEEGQNAINEPEKDPVIDFLENSDIPEVLQSSLWDVGGDEITDYPNDYENLQKNALGVGETVAISEDSRGSLVDLPTGVPESEKEVPGEPLTPQDFENAKNLEILVPPQDEGSPDPILSAGLFEGDIAGVNISDLISFGKNGIRDFRKRWPGGIIPYVISSSFSVYERSVIAAAVLDFYAYTCIRFVPRTTQWDYIHLQKGAGCSSLVGRFGGGQQVSLGAGCLYKGIVEHELMHACGFWHEQSRGDRDEYVRILWNNIVPGKKTFNATKIYTRP
ncbi:Zinc metalloproteinase nas-6 [Zootermopsis nevadensis]|uniref:Metalloendopeptidase n=1 Tax=Zootermopsis nevadensis TaxID=136037 RepID=A0A067RA41_ZOONE|nr:Zinc metalloproteinase nas-6 [Zootermopsis nevadensis]